MGDDIISYNGGVALAMKGKECVAIACDKRYGVQNRTIATNFTKIFQYGDYCFVAFCGLATDVSFLVVLILVRPRITIWTQQHSIHIKLSVYDRTVGGSLSRMEHLSSEK